MRKNQTTSADPADFRRRAEDKLRKKQESQRPEAEGRRTRKETQRLVHELQVHQIELEMQNEELLLARSEAKSVAERYTDLYDFAPIGYFTLDRNGTILQVNLTGARLLGQERSRLVRCRFGLFVSEDDLPTFNAFLDRVFQNRGQESCEVTFLGEQPPGSRHKGDRSAFKGRGLFARIEGVVSEEGKACRVLVADITERKRAEVALEESEERFRTLADSAPDGIFRFDRELRLLYANPVGAYWLGLEGPLEFPVAEYDLPTVFIPGWESPAREVFETGHLRRYETSIKRKGKIWTYEMIMAPELGSDGLVHSVISIARDITERRRTEEERRQHAEGLEILSGNATRMLGHLSMPDLYRIVADQIHAVAGGAAVAFNEFDQQSGKIIVREFRATPEEREKLVRILGREPEGISLDFSEEVRAWMLPDEFGLVEGGLHVLSFEQIQNPIFEWIEKELHFAGVFATACKAEDELLGTVAILTHGSDASLNKRLIESIVNQAALVLKRKRIEEALRESEVRLKRSQEMSHLGSWELDLVANRLTWSDEVYRIFGLQPQRFGANYEAFLDAVHPDDRARVDAAYSDSLREGRDSYEIEHRVVRRSDGEIRVVHEKCEHFRDASGQIVRSIGMVHDITERKVSERRLAYLASFPEQNPQPIIEVDADGRVRYANPTALRLFPWILEEGSAHPWLADWEIAMRSLREETHTGTREVTVGECSYHLGLYYLPDEQVVRVYGWDITDRKEAEEGLRTANAQLIEADLHKNEFLAMLSHELRNPLVPIRNSVYILERAIHGGEQAGRAITVIDRQTKHLAQLVDDLLDVTRITNAKIRLQCRPVRLNEIVHEVVEDYCELFVRNGISLEVRLADGPLDIYGDPTRLSQIVGNLLSNAAKFTPRGGRTTLSLEPGDDHSAILRVRDTGVGIGPETFRTLFEPFAQGEHSLDRSRGGLGLGLALVKGLVELHGGAVAASSAGIGQGCEFVVRLPLLEEKQPEAVCSETPICHDTKGRRVLIIEDNVDAAESLKEVLELLGHAVEVAYDGSTGIDLIRAVHPDVILCDIGLPGIDGYQVARILRADPHLCQSTLVALSGYAQPEDIARAMEAGFDQHLAKPPSLEELERVLSYRAA